MRNVFEYFSENDYLAHHGILGQKWGVRRYQNPDGTLTDSGKKRYAKKLAKYTNKDELINKLVNEYATNKAIDRQALKAKRKAWLDAEAENDKFDESPERKEASRKAYQDTFDWFAKNDSAYLQSIIAENNGKKTGLDAFHDFRKLNEGYEDDTIRDAEKAYYQRTGLDPSKASKALSDYVDECAKARDAIVGRYGNIQVKNIHDTDFLGRSKTNTLNHYLNAAEWKYFEK